IPAVCYIFFISATAIHVIYTLSLHDALPISAAVGHPRVIDSIVPPRRDPVNPAFPAADNRIHADAAFRADTPGLLQEPDAHLERSEEHTSESSHVKISYAVFCLKKKKLSSTR